MKRTFALLLALLMVAILFVGCSPAGTYHVKTIDGKDPYDYYIDEFKKQFDADEDDVKELLEYLKIDEDDLKDPMVLEINKDGTYKLKSNVNVGDADDNVEKGTWTKKGNTITFVADDADDDDENTELTIKGGKLYGISTDGEETEFVFVKGK